MTVIALPTAHMTPTRVSEVFWQMGEHFKELLSNTLTRQSPGVVSWDVTLLPAHEIVTFERTPEGLMLATWVTVNPLTKNEDFNEVAFTQAHFDNLFSGDLAA